MGLQGRERNQDQARAGRNAERGGRGVRGAVVLLALLLGACSVPIADLPIVGLPADAPKRPAEPAAYPAVHDMPAPRDEPMLDPTEQAKVENDLKSARERQEKGAAADDAVADKAAAKTSDKARRKGREKGHEKARDKASDHAAAKTPDQND